MSGVKLRLLMYTMYIWLHAPRGVVREVDTIFVGLFDIDGKICGF